MRVHALVFAAIAMTVSMSGYASDVSELCTALGRSNIDCACVTKRSNVFRDTAPNAAWERLIEQAYRNAVGVENSYRAQYEAIYSDMQRAVIEEMAFEDLGGAPGNIEDFEGACAIPGAPPAEFPAPRSTPSVDRYQELCVASTGDPRYCACLVGQIQPELSDTEFEAYFRSFSDYEDKEAISLDQMAEARGKTMGMTGEEFVALQSQAREKVDAIRDARENYCEAILWAEERDGTPAELRATGGFTAEALQAAAAPAAPSIADSSGSPLDKARSLIQQNCPAQGNSEGYCACYLNEFETVVVPAAGKESVALAWVATISPFAGDDTEFLKLSQQMTPQDQQALGPLMMQTMGVGDSCPQEEVASAQATAATASTAAMDGGPDGSPQERMLAMCMEDNDDRAACDCLVGKMSESLEPDDFELLVDIRQAEFNGADDPFAVVAQQRGLSGPQAQMELLSSQSMLMGVMGMNLMACMSGMPGMPAINN